MSNIHRNWSATVAASFNVDASKTVKAYGKRYGADGWSEVKMLFSFNPLRDSTAPLEQARELAVSGPGGHAMHGAENVTHVA